MRDRDRDRQIVLECQELGYLLRNRRQYSLLADLRYNRALISLFWRDWLSIDDAIESAFGLDDRSFRRATDIRYVGETIRWGTDEGLVQAAAVDGVQGWRILDRTVHFMEVGPMDRRYALRITGITDDVERVRVQRLVNREESRVRRAAVKEAEAERRFAAHRRTQARAIVSEMVDLDPTVLLAAEPPAIQCAPGEWRREILDAHPPHEAGLARFAIGDIVTIAECAEILIDAAGEDRAVLQLLNNRMRELKAHLRMLAENSPEPPDEDADAMADLAFE